MEKKTMTEEYIIRDKLFDTYWAGSLISSWIPREWTLEEKDVVERVFGKDALLKHDVFIKNIKLNIGKEEE